ncbi:MAG: hypothetical protein ACOZQL_32935 [Myxococcota bacterium]
MPSPEVSGRAFLGLINHLREAHGRNALVELKPLMSREAAAAFDTRILHSSWYPYEAYVGFLRAIVAKHGNGKLEYCRQLGVSSGVRDINTVFKIYLAIASTERLIRGCTKVWDSYYRNAGMMEAVRWTPDDTMLRISDFKKMAPEHCLLMEGWMIATMNALGCDVLEPRESKCTSRGDEAHEFSCKWKKR